MSDFTGYTVPASLKSEFTPDEVNDMVHQKFLAQGSRGEGETVEFRSFPTSPVVFTGSVSPSSLIGGRRHRAASSNEGGELV